MLELSGEGAVQQRNGNFQRRLVTIVCADVARFTTLTADNEEATLTTWLAYTRIAKDICGNRGGRIFGTAGDSFMVEFERPLDAMRSALELQDRLTRENARLPEHRRMRFRLGMSIGDVLVQEDRLFGEEVNIAARLQELAEPGGIVVAEVVYSHVAARVSCSFEDLGEIALHNIPRKVHARRVASANLRGPVHLTAPGSATANPSRIDLAAPVPGFAGRPALAVLPFDFLGSDRELEYTADSLADELIDGLGRLHWFPVISRDSSFAFRSGEADPAFVGAALGARYVVTGKVFVDGDLTRVTAALRDAETARLVWSEGYDRRTADFLSVQGEIVRSIVSTLDSRIDLSEQARVLVRPVASLDTGELVRRGVSHQRRLRKGDAEQARRFFNLALDRDPDNVEALIQLSWWHFWDNWTKRGPPEGRERMAELARRALAIDPDDARAHMLIGIAEMMSGRPEASIGPLTDAIRRNPSLSVPHAVIGSAHILSGHPELGIAPLMTAMRLNPHDLYLFHLLGELAVAHYMLGNWDTAIGWCDGSLSLRPGYWYPRVIKAGALARSGQAAEAAAAVAELESCSPGFRPEHVRWLPFLDDRWHRYLLEGLKLAGYPLPTEGDTSTPTT